MDLLHDSSNIIPQLSELRSKGSKSYFPSLLIELGKVLITKEKKTLNLKVITDQVDKMQD